MFFPTYSFAIKFQTILNYSHVISTFTYPMYFLHYWLKLLIRYYCQFQICWKRVELSPEFYWEIRIISLVLTLVRHPDIWNWPIEAHNWSNLRMRYCLNEQLSWNNWSAQGSRVASSAWELEKNARATVKSGSMRHCTYTLNTSVFMYLCICVFL